MKSHPRSAVRILGAAAVVVVAISTLPTPATAITNGGLPSHATSHEQLRRFTPLCRARSFRRGTHRRVTLVGWRGQALTLHVTQRSACLLTERWPLATASIPSHPSYRLAGTEFLGSLVSSDFVPIPATPLTLRPGEEVAVEVLRRVSSYRACADVASIAIHFTGGGQLLLNLRDSGFRACVNPNGNHNLFISPFLVNRGDLIATGRQLPRMLPPPGDTQGYYYGADSSGQACSGSGPYHINMLGIDGACGGYMGMIGAFWQNIGGCPQSGWAWNQTDYSDANANYEAGQLSGEGLGVGSAPIFLIGGPGVDPNFNSNAPLATQVSEAQSWGRAQAQTAVYMFVADNDTWDIPAFYDEVRNTPASIPSNAPAEFCNQAGNRCADFFGGVTSSSSQAVAWQWMTPVYTAGDYSVDIDQISAQRI